MDQTIIATALPTIVSNLGGGKNYSWIGSAFLLAAATLSPLYGKLSDIIGRKPILYTCLIIFLIGSALCGAAQSMVWLIFCRAVQGVGGGRMIQMIQIIISDIVTLEERVAFMLLVPFNANHGINAVPHRCFWINLPTRGAAFFMLFFLNVSTQETKPYNEHLREFDFVGLFLIVAGVVCLLIGFNYSEVSWSSMETIVLVTIRASLLVISSVHEALTKKSAIIPRRLFQTRTTAVLLITVFLHSATFFPGAYYLPVYYQILGASPTGAGVRMIPFSFGAALFAIISGIIVSKTKDYRMIMWIGWAIFTLGYGLMTMLDSHSNTYVFSSPHCAFRSQFMITHDLAFSAMKVLYPFVASFGIGSLFQVPLIALQAAMPRKDVARSTSAFGFVRTLSGTVGISIGQAVFLGTLRRRLQKIPNLSVSTSSSALSESVRHLSEIANPNQRAEIIQAYTKSISSIWLVCLPMIGASFLMSALTFIDTEILFGNQAYHTGSKSL
ncbi:hypothetical protein D9758_004724 [Tetrapyrgos nigripes]|uniref:Major facilitator superfamily (MFS) profile domain-containing protein n=1 Tax=Tetrapyrgos nigripes TaxID=182062 RepID=A0A8H5LY16_9AGAR|nr:hypothetical protein D9758_004724 [Tetrapyrgos nigripes]